MGQNSSARIINPDTQIDEYQQEFISTLISYSKSSQKLTSQIINSNIPNIILLKKAQKTIIKQFQFEKFFVGSISISDSQIPLFSYFTLTFHEISFLIIKLSQKVHIRVIRFIQSQSFELSEKQILTKIISLYQEDIKFLSTTKYQNKNRQKTSSHNIETSKGTTKPIDIPKMIITAPFLLSDSESPEEDNFQNVKSKKISVVIKSPVKKGNSDSNKDMKSNSSTSDENNLINNKPIKQKSSGQESYSHTHERDYSYTDNNQGISNERESDLSYEETPSDNHSKQSKKNKRNIPQLNMNAVNDQNLHIRAPVKKHKEDSEIGNEQLSSKFYSSSILSPHTSEIITPSEIMSKNVLVGSPHDHTETNSKKSNSSTKRSQRRSQSVHSSSHRHHIRKNSTNGSLNDSISESKEQKVKSILDTSTDNYDYNNLLKMYDFDSYITGSNGRRKIKVRRPSSKSSHSSSTKRSQSVPRNSATRIELSRQANEFASEMAFLSSDEEHEPENKIDNTTQERNVSCAEKNNLLSENEDDDQLSFFEIPEFYQNTTIKDKKTYEDADVQNVFSDFQSEDLKEQATVNIAIQIEQTEKKDQSTQNDNIPDTQEMAIQNTNSSADSNQNSSLLNATNRDMNIDEVQNENSIQNQEETAPLDQEKSDVSKHNLSHDSFSQQYSSSRYESSSHKSHSKHALNSKIESKSQHQSDIINESDSQIQSSSTEKSSSRRSVNSRQIDLNNESDSYLTATTSGEYGVILYDKDLPGPEVEVLSKTRKGHLKRKRLIKNDEIELFAQSPRNYSKISPHRPHKRTEDEKNQIWDSIKVSSSHKNSSANVSDSGSRSSSKIRRPTSNSRMESDKGSHRSSKSSSIKSSSNGSHKRRSASVTSEHKHSISELDDYEIDSNKIMNSSSTQNSSTNISITKTKSKRHNESSSRRSQSVSSRSSKT